MTHGVSKDNNYFSDTLFLSKPSESLDLAPVTHDKPNNRRTLPRETILAMLAKGLRPTVIARDLGVSRLSVYRVKLERAERSEGAATTAPIPGNSTEGC